MRKSNFELLRIISMMMVVGLHYLNPSMGGALAEQSSTEINYYITFALESLFIVGVNCFILITGYFQIEKSSIKISKAVELIMIMIFYGILFYTIAIIAGWTTFSIVGLILEMFPILAGLKWFIKVYIVLYLLIPFINKGLNAMSKKEYQSFLIIYFALFSIYPSFLPSPPVTDNGYGIITFVLMYAIGGYFKKHYRADKSKVFYFSGYLLNAAATFIFAITMDITLGGGLNTVWGYNFVFNVLCSVFLFLFFSKIDISSIRINKIASYALGVYFVHTSPITYDFLYGYVLKTQNFWHSPLFIIHLFTSILLVYFVATLIDMVRKKIFDFIKLLIKPYTEKFEIKFGQYNIYK
uniref:acyltransferase n=1 Tax=Aerococcus urinaeequi TaxID=51665 RepID=UPI00352A7175